MEKINTDCKIMAKIVDKFRLNFSRCINRDVAPLNIAIFVFHQCFMLHQRFHTHPNNKSTLPAALESLIQSAEYGKCKSFVQMLCLVLLQMALHTQDLVEFCHTQTAEHFFLLYYIKNH